MAWGYRGRGFNSSWKKKRGAYGYGRKSYGRKKWGGRRGTYRQGFRKNYRSGMLLNKAELKSNTLAISNGTTNALAPLARAWTSLAIPTNIAAGDDINQRDGRQIRLSSLLLRLRLDNTTVYDYPVGGTTWSVYNRAPQNVRVCVIWDKYPNGVQAATSEIFQVSADTGGGIQNVMAPMELKNRRRFRMLSDKVYALGTVNNQVSTQTSRLSFGAPPVKYINQYIKLKARETTYGATGATIGACNEGALLIWACSSEEGPLDGTSQAYACGVIGTARLRFTG